MSTATIDRPRRMPARTAPVARHRPAARPRPARASRRTALLRRRMLAFVVLVAAVMAIALSLAMESQASSDAGVLEATVVVGAGETIWDIAGDYLPAGHSQHAYVARVLRHNGIDASAVAPGTVLHLPRP